jgi:cell division protein FtsQ
VQAQPIEQRSFGSYIRNGKIPAVVLLFGAGWLLYTTLMSPHYVVQQVRLEGGSALTEADVAALSAVQGQSIWNVEPDDVEARVAQSPYVEQASAQVLLPATVVVHVRERQPAMRWQQGETVYDVTQDGRILAAIMPSASPSVAAATDVVTATASISQTVPAAPSPSVITSNSVVVIDTTPDRVLEPGSYVDPDALEVARRVALRAAELPAPLEQIKWEQNIGVVLQVGGRTVVVGNSERLDEKLAILVQVLREQTPFTMLDLRPSAPYLR